jgi:hypothetical protein
MCQRNDFIAMLCDLCLGMNWITGINSDHRYGLNVNRESSTVNLHSVQWVGEQAMGKGTVVMMHVEMYSR